MLKKRFFKTLDEAEVTFELEANGADEAAVVGEFNNWEPIPMKLSKKAGSFRTKVRLPKGETFQFRYLLDGETWENDGDADQFVRNEYGGNNSVVSTVQ